MESPTSNAGDGIGYRHRGQTGAFIESMISNAGDAISNLIVGHRGWNNNFSARTAIFSHFCRLVGGIEVVIQVADLDGFSKHGSYAGCYSEQ